MGLFSFLLTSLRNFLFVRNADVLELEKLSEEGLLKILPASAPEEESGAIALFDYGNGLVKELVWAVKYGGNRTIADKLGGILYDVIISELMERNVFERFERAALVPIPVSDKRRFERGWNQAELICEAIKRRDRDSKLKYLPRQLVKIRHTESQTRTASKKEREENLRGSMLVQHKGAVDGAFVVLVDDVTTTGSTFAEARRALKEAGAKRVLCIAVAH